MDPGRTAVDESPAPAPVAVLLENHRAFLRYLERRVGDRTLAEDILQDAFAVNSVGLLLMLNPALALMSFVVIPREERYLEARCPSEDVPYKASVRRWL